MATLAAQNIALTGLNPVYVAAAVGGDEFVNDGKKFFHAKNGGAADVTITFNTQTLCNYGFDHDQAVIVPIGGDRIIGPFPTGRFNDVNSKVQGTYSGVTSLTVAVLGY